MWTQKELIENININVKDYGAKIVVSCLYKKIYGELPKGIGLSGEQANVINSIELPNI